MKKFIRKIISLTTAAAAVTTVINTVPASAATEKGLKNISSNLKVISSIDSVKPSDFEPKDDLAKSDVRKAYSDMESKYSASYDLRDYGYVTSVKDQGNDGLCWAYSTLASAESNVLKKNLKRSDLWNTNGELTFSVGSLAYFPYTDSSLNSDDFSGDYIESEKKGDDGGNSFISQSVFAAGHGLEPENDAATTVFTGGGNYSEYRRNASYYRLNSSEYLKRANSAANIETVKGWLESSGAVDVAFCHNSYCYSYDETDKSYSYYQTRFSYENANHEVSIVGWDDNYSASKFNATDMRTGRAMTPPADGAWLIKNSWGSSESNNGYIWISYYEPSLCDFMKFDFETNDTSDNIVQYDGSFCVNAYNFDATANIFTAENNQVLKSVGFYVSADIGSAVNYRADVYLLDDTTKNPESGQKVATVSGTENFAGYKKKDLPTQVALAKGQRYSIVLHLTDPYTGNVSYSEIEENCHSSWAVFHYEAKPGESYIIDSGRWADSTEYRGEYGALGNVPIKAYTDDTDGTHATNAKNLLDFAINNANNAGLGSSIEYAQANEISSKSSSPRDTETAALNLLGAVADSGRISYPDGLLTDFIKGDVNDDGVVDSSDATFILIYYAEKLLGDGGSLKYKAELAADTNDDGTIDSSDATVILIYYARVLIGENVSIESVAKGGI